MRRKYVVEDVEITRLPIEGLRIDRIFQGEYKVAPRLYSVIDRNLKAKGPWVVELFERRVQERTGRTHVARVLSVALAPKRASKRMVSLTRQSILSQPAKKRPFTGKPYVHVTFRDPQAFGGKETAARGERELLPSWLDHYQSRLRLRETVQGKVKSRTKVGRTLGGVHDSKQVIVLKDNSDEELIRLFFAMRVFSAEKGFGLK